MKTWLMIDYGGVLADDHVASAEFELARVLRSEPAVVRAALSERSPHGRAIRLDAMSEDDFWSKVCSEICPQWEAPLSPKELTKLWARCYSIRESVSSILIEVRDKNLEVGIATNVDQYREHYLLAELVKSGIIARIWASYEIGYVKPDINYYKKIDRILTKQSGPAMCLYIDNRQSHVDAASTIGWSAIAASDPKVIRSWLMQHQVLQ